MNDLIRVCHEPNRGRCVIANNDLPAGVPVLLDNAYASISLQACNWCFSSPQERANSSFFALLPSETADSLFRCSRCKVARYCTKKCQKCDWNEGNHRSECISWKTVEQALRTRNSEKRSASYPTILFVMRLAAQMYQTASSDPTGNLCHHYGRNEFDQEKLQEFSEMAQLVFVHLLRVSIIQNNELEPRNSKQNDTKSTLLQITKLFCMVQCNVFTICNTLNEPLGIGLYPKAAMLNHSCTPNCIVRFDLTRKQAVIHTIETIHSGQELTISYVDIFDPTTIRKKRLRSSYFFDCTCQRCTSSQEDAFLEGFLCTQCRNTSESARILDEKKRIFRCCVCAHETPIDRHFERMYFDWKSVLKSSNMSIDFLERKWKLTKVLRLHYRNATRATTARALSNAWLSYPSCSEMERQMRAVEYTFEEYQATEWILPTKALPSRGLLCFQFARILISLAEMETIENLRFSSRLSAFLRLKGHSGYALPLLEEARTLLHQALSILKCGYGRSHAIIEAMETWYLAQVERYIQEIR
uniref:Uncharacterized protein AlNc14C172G8026 n=1 Tax=Albugo laibachii Nc14 TaxID=890382 RepID=F0WNK3_9STRA|nr:conserved hypothetical protein [Albugo laibachii Nc14]|eukprot:CCA22894.1 conserved hypothetical protein [Albugo laibachii Nc14]